MPLVCPCQGPSEPCSGLLNSPCLHLCAGVQEDPYSSNARCSRVPGICFLPWSLQWPLWRPLCRQAGRRLSLGNMPGLGRASNIKSFLRFAGDVHLRTVVCTLSYWSGMTESAVYFPQGWGSLFPVAVEAPAEAVTTAVAWWSLCCTLCVAVCFPSVQLAWPPLVRGPFSSPVHSQWLL